jgi:hypothetical protein
MPADKPSASGATSASVPQGTGASSVDPPGGPLVEFDRTGFREVAKSPADLARESATAIVKAMETIREVGEQATEAITGMVRPPAEAELKFGIRLDAEAGALIAKASTGATLEVTLTWNWSDKAENEIGRPTAGS